MRAQETEVSPQEITKRWLWRLGLLFLFFLAALVATFIIWRINLSRKIDRTLATIQKEGYAVSLAQLEQKYYPNIASNENAAPFFLNAFASLQETNDEKRKIPVLPGYQSANKPTFFSRTNLELITNLLNDNRNALALLHQSPPATNCRYPINLTLGPDMSAPHLRPLRDSARLLSLQAIIHAESGDSGASIEDLKAIFRLCHSLDREPVTISQTSRIIAESDTIDALEYLLNLRLFTDVQLARLSQLFHDLENPAGLQSAMNGELCEGAYYFQWFGVKTPAPGALENQNSSGGSLTRVADFNKLTGFFNRSYAFYLETMLKKLRISKLPFPRRLDAAIQLQNSREMSRHSNSFPAAFLLLDVSRSDFRDCRMNARAKIIQTVPAIERYRLTNQNRLPDNLSDLVPAFLDYVPMDPFVERPIRYKKLAKGYMVYSIGPDRKDDGGVYLQKYKQGSPSDITFVVER